MNIHKAPNAPQVMAQIYFGGNITSGDGVTIHIGGEAFARFLNDYITPTFPGFTVTTAQGYWKGRPETVRVLTILAPDSDGLRNNVRQFAERYKTEFAQEAVAYSFTACEFTLDCWPYGPVRAYHRDGKGY